MNRVAALLITLALIAGMAGCPAAPLQLELEVLSTSGGSVTAPGEGTFTYTAGTVVELVAVPDECYRFANWTGDTVVAPESASTTITVDAAKSVTANFAPVRYSLTISSTDGGSVTTPSEGTFAYDCGSVVDLVASPDKGYRFASWSGDIHAVADHMSAQTTINMGANCSINADFEAGYAIFDTLLEGLSTPALHAMDGQGRIYFTESDSLHNTHRISRLDPVTGEALQLVEHQDAISVRSLSVDGQGNLYYVLRREASVEPATVVMEICRLAPAELTSQVLFSTQGLAVWVTFMTVDYYGNVYFGLHPGVGEFGLAPGSELRRIPAGAGTTEILIVLEEVSGGIRNINVAHNPNILYFTVELQEIQRICRFDVESRALDTVLERPAARSGRIAYLATRANGELYYLYRQRSEPTDPVQFGYLEIGRFTLQALETSQPPELLVADELDESVYVWIPFSLNFLAVSETGDVFFEIILCSEAPVELCPVSIFWFDPLTVAYVALVEDIVGEAFGHTFVLDNSGNICYAAYYADTIVRIKR